MSISAVSINLVKTSLIHLREAGVLPANDYEELMTAITRPANRPEPTKPSHLITRDAGAKMLGISTRSFDRLLNLKENVLFHPIRVGKRSLRINQAELEAFINQTTPAEGKES